MRKLSADYIYSPEGKFLRKAIIIVDDNGVIKEIKKTHGNLQETPSLEYYNGILIPGFVNTHCHSELSHMKGMITGKKGLPAFLHEVISKRFEPDNLNDIIERANLEMAANGIVAVGDISNQSDSFGMKRKSNIHYHTFIELFTSDDKNIPDLIKKSEVVKSMLQELPGNYVPHASYSVSEKLFEEINKLNDTKDTIISIHNQETESEDELYLSQSGELYEQLKAIGFNYDNFNFCNKNSIQTYLPKLSNDKNILLIHNTYTKEQDIDFAENYSKKLYWVFCPASNLIIENNLPNIPLFFDKNVKTCIGTDSYASNTELSVLHELKIISKHFSEIKLNNLLDSACINGAKALNIEANYGSLSPGKKPGINLISEIDYNQMKLTDDSDVRVIV